MNSRCTIIGSLLFQIRVDKHSTGFYQRMKHPILQSVSSQLYSHGNSEPKSDVPTQLDSKINGFGNRFWSDAELVVYGNSNQLTPQSTIIYQPGTPSLATIKGLNYPHLEAGSSFTNIPHEQPWSISNKFFITESHTATNGRKWSIDISKRGFNNLVGEKTTMRERTKSKKKAAYFQEQWHNQVKEDLSEIIQRQRVPVRRSQKLSDRITALQKLVSPYGKTDTVSVLQEALVSIKALQDQIQKLFQTSSVSYTTTRPLDLQKSGENELDLRSRGLCLVPVSLTQEIGRRKTI